MTRTSRQMLLNQERFLSAVQQGDLDTSGLLLGQGVDVNQFDDLGKTPLHYAAEGEFHEIASLLISHGAKVNAHHLATIGDTPLGGAAGSCSLRMASLLLAAGADPAIPGWMQLTAIDRARGRKRGEGPLVLELLLVAAKRRNA
jgi:ankyrin repeat protein